MAEFFLTLLNLSIQAGYLVLAVLLLRLFLKKAPKWIAPILWGIVALRLLLPISLESALSLLPQKEPISPQILYTQEYTQESPQTPDISPDTPLPSVDTPAVDAPPSQQPEPSGTPAAPTISVTAPAHSPAQVALNIGLFVWLAGLSVMLVSTVISYINLRRSILTAVRKQDNIYQSETVGSPFVLGLLRARIYLPFSLSEQDIPYIIAHEKAHIRRLDHLWKPLGFLLLAVHWFNPLIWVAYILLCRDIELACDEAVIQKLEASQRADYSQALLHCSTPRKSIAACPVAFGEFGVKARVRQILRYNKPAFWIVLIAIVVCIAVAVCFLTVPPQTNVVAQKALRLEIADPTAPEGMPRRYLYFALNEPEHTVGYEGYPMDLTLEANEEQVTLAFSAELLQDGTAVKEIILRSEDSLSLDAPAEDLTYIFSLVTQEEMLSAQMGQEQSMLWFDLLAKPEEGFEEASYSSPDFPGVHFHCDGKTITVETDTGTRTVLAADAILNAYFYDITNDSIPELCITAQVGAQTIDTRIYVYEYYRAKGYELSDRKTFDYSLVKAEDQLLVRKCIFDQPENVLVEGVLSIAGGKLQMTVVNKLSELPTEPPTEPTEPPKDPILDWELPDYPQLSYDEYFCETRYYFFQERGEDKSPKQLYFWGGWRSETDECEVWMEDGKILAGSSLSGKYVQVGTETYENTKVTVCDEYWIYLIKDNTELFRIDYNGENRQTLHVDETQKIAPFDITYTHVRDNSVLFFVAATGEDYGIYRLYLPDMTLDLLYTTEAKPFLYGPYSNFEITWSCKVTNAGNNIHEIDYYYNCLTGELLERPVYGDRSWGNTTWAWWNESDE